MEKEYLLLLLGIAVIVILALVTALLFYRRQLAKCKASLVRCINENIEMKQKLPDYELPHFIMRDELTPEEFVQIIHNMMKRLMFVASLLVLFNLTVSAHVEKNPDSSTFTFRFRPYWDTLYAPWNICDE